MQVEYAEKDDLALVGLVVEPVAAAGPPPHAPSVTEPASATVHRASQVPRFGTSRPAKDKETATSAIFCPWILRGSCESFDSGAVVRQRHRMPPDATSGARSSLWGDQKATIPSPPAEPLTVTEPISLSEPFGAIWNSSTMPFNPVCT